jgi:pseudouridine-5'-phosphate glycosidase
MKVRIYFDNKPQVKNGRLVFIPQTIVNHKIPAPATDTKINEAVETISRERGQLPAQVGLIA